MNPFRSDFMQMPLLIAADWLLVVCAEQLAYWLRRDGLPIAVPTFHIPDVYLYLIVPAIFLVFLHESRMKFRAFPLWKMTQAVFHAVLWSVLAIIMLMYFGHVAQVVSRLFVAMTGVFAFLFLIAGRTALAALLDRYHLFEVPVLLVGGGDEADALLSTLAAHGGCGMHCIGLVTDARVPQKAAARCAVLGHLADLERVIGETGIQNVLVTASGADSDEQVRLVARIQPLVANVVLVPDLAGLPVANSEIEGILEGRHIFLRFRNNLARRKNLVFKRLFDIVLCLLGAPLVLPVCLAIALAIKHDDGGPVFFAHRRVGQGGKEFPCSKFRTMVTDGDRILADYLAAHPEARKDWENDFKLKDDPRVTKIGAFLRKTSLDELPQVWNVLKGDMSLVGPRPIIRAEIPKYGEHFADFCLVPPGITGMWQVNGRSDTTYEGRVRMDSWYVRNWSVWIDLACLVRTFAVVLRREGAY